MGQLVQVDPHVTAVRLREQPSGAHEADRRIASDNHKLKPLLHIADHLNTTVYSVLAFEGCATACVSGLRSHALFEHQHCELVRRYAHLARGLMLLGKLRRGCATLLWKDRRRVQALGLMEAAAHAFEEAAENAASARSAM